MPIRDQIAPNRRVAVLVYDGLCAFEFGCAAEVFGLPRPELGRDWYRFETCAPERRPLRGQYGTRIVADGGLDRLARAGTIVVPGWKGVDVDVPEPILGALRRAHARGARLVSICSGAFVLAATGLLDGKRATTHWRYAEALRRRFPRVRVDPDVLYVDEERVLTSAGSAAGLDLCLHLVRRDFGPDVANAVARRLVIPPHRDGGQAQFVERPVQPREGSAIAALIARVQRRPELDYDVASMARAAHMSTRTFLRRFKDSTGESPGQWLVAIRVDRARELLEGTRLDVETVAARVGLGTATTLRHHFRRRVGLGPAAYRARFGRGG